MIMRIIMRIVLFASICMNILLVGMLSGFIYIIDLGDIGSIAQAIAVSLNVVLIIYFFEADKKYKKRELIITTNLHWYTDLIIEKNFHRVDTLFQNINNIIKTNLGEIDAHSTIEQYGHAVQNVIYSTTDEIYNFQNDFISLLEIIDTCLSAKAFDILVLCQDSIASQLDSAKSINLNELYNLTSSGKQAFLKELIDYSQHLLSDKM